MALQISVLNQQLINVMESDAPFFVGYPDDVNQAAENYSTAIVEYAKTITPISITVQPAKQAFCEIYVGMNNQLMNGEVIFQLAIKAFAQQLAVGMQPAFTGIAPVSPIILAPLMQAGLLAASGEICAGILANIIHTWFLTGTATNQNTGVTINWF